MKTLWGGGSKETRSLLAQSRDRYSPYMKELETVYNVLNKQCIRHLTMSTTDPSAAKPDGFAIGSI
ncbi:hypothetical protein BB560_002157, partial [Smittium megazygosporum]